MPFTNPFSFDVFDSPQGKNADQADKNAAGALGKIQDDSRPKTTLVEQAAEQNPPSMSDLVLQAAKQIPRPVTNLVQQAAEQNSKDTVTRNVESILLGQPTNRPSGEPTTDMVRQAAEQNKDTAIRNVENILSENFMNFDKYAGEPTTDMVRQAAEQNKDTVIRNVESILIENFKNYDAQSINRFYYEDVRKYQTPGMHQFFNDDFRKYATPGIHKFFEDDSKSNELPGISQFFREDMKRNEVPGIHKFFTEDFKKNDLPGLHKWFSEDLETNIMANVSQILTRGNAMELLSHKPKEFFLGTVGELQALDPKDFWHSQNDKADLSRYVKQNLIAAKQDSKSVDMAIAGLTVRIDQNLNDVKSGRPLDAQQTDRMRQMAENAAMIKIAAAELQQAKDPKAAKDMVSGTKYSVSDLIRIAEDHGANKDNIQQLKKMVERFEKR